MATRAILADLHAHVFEGTGEGEALLAKHAAADSETLIDSLWTISLEAEHASDEDPDAWERMVQLVKVCRAKAVVPTATLVARLEPSLLEAGGILPAGVFRKRLVKANTTQMYVQVKFNLMHESHEGYAKLGVFLAALASDEAAKSSGTSASGEAKREEDDAAPSGARAAAATVEALIGRFRLDPNRVLDAVLEAYEMCASTSTIFNRLLALFKRANYAHTLGFKLQQLHARGAVTPPSLMCLIGRMVDAGELELDAIWPHLAPEDGALAAQQKACAAAVVARAKRLGKVSLNSSYTGDEAAGEGAASAAAAHPSAAAVNALAAARQSNVLNQKFALVRALLDVNAWDTAEVVLTRLADAGICAADDDGVCSALMALLSRRTEKLHKAATVTVACGGSQSARATSSSSTSGGPSSTSSSVVAMEVEEGALLEDASSSAFKTASAAAAAAATHSELENSPLLCRAKGTLCGDMWKQLKWLRHRVSREPGFYARIARLLAHVYSEKSVQLVLKMPSRGQKAALMKIISRCLLPALSACEDASTVLLDDKARIRPAPAFFFADQVWLILGKMPFAERYAAYEEWKAEAYGGSAHMELILAQRDAQSSIRALLKRCSKDNMRKQGRLVARVSHPNPIVTLEAIVALVESYENMIVPIVGSLKYLSSLSFDVLSFVMVKALSSERSKINLRDGINASHWLDSLAKFCGAVCRKHFSIELQGVLSFVVQRLKANEALDIVILIQLLTAMTGVQTSDPTVCGEAELEAQAGGLHLQMESSVLLKRVRSKASAHSADALRKAMVKSKVILPLLILTARQSPSILYSTSDGSDPMRPSDALPLKVMGSQHDSCVHLLTQLTQVGVRFYSLLL